MKAVYSVTLTVDQRDDLLLRPVLSPSVLPGGSCFSTYQIRIVLASRSREHNLGELHRGTRHLPDYRALLLNSRSTGSNREHDGPIPRTLL